MTNVNIGLSRLIVQLPIKESKALKTLQNFYALLVLQQYFYGLYFAGRSLGSAVPSCGMCVSGAKPAQSQQHVDTDGETDRPAAALLADRWQIAAVCALYTLPDLDQDLARIERSCERGSVMRHVQHPCLGVRQLHVQWIVKRTQ